MSLVWTARPTAAFARNTTAADIMSAQMTNDVLYCSWQLQAVDRSGEYIPYSLSKPVEPIRPDKNHKRAAKATGTVQRKKRNNNKPLTDDLLKTWTMKIMMGWRNLLRFIRYQRMEWLVVMWDIFQEDISKSTVQRNSTKFFFAS
jgi:hypothetical protein